MEKKVISCFGVIRGNRAKWRSFLSDEGDDFLGVDVNLGWHSPPATAGSDTDRCSWRHPGVILCQAVISQKAQSDSKTGQEGHY